MKRSLIGIGFGVFLTLVCGLGIYPAHAQGVCRSPRGGYCANLPERAPPAPRARDASSAQIRIPGVEFLNVSSESFGDLVDAVFKFGLVVVAISSLVMVILGGVNYLTAGDNANRVKEGKTRIGNALLGLIIALLSWLILYTINPNLVSKTALDITRIGAGKPFTPSQGHGSGSHTVTAGGDCESSDDCLSNLVCTSHPSGSTGVCSAPPNTGNNNTGTGLQQGQVCDPLSRVNQCAPGLSCGVDASTGQSFCGP